MMLHIKIAKYNVEPWDIEKFAGNFFLNKIFILNIWKLYYKHENKIIGYLIHTCIVIADNQKGSKVGRSTSLQWGNLADLQAHSV